MGEYAVHKNVASQLTEGAKIAIVMDYPTVTEVRLNKMLAGDYILGKVCKLAGIQLEDCMLTHVFQRRPAQENLQNFFHKRSEYKALCKGTEWRTPYPSSTLGFLKQEAQPHLERLYKEINDIKPNVILALGAVSLWAFTGYDKIGTYRGALISSNTSHINDEIKIVPSYALSSVSRNYALRSIMYSDFKKAVQESETKDIVNIERELWIEPSINDLDKFKEDFIKKDNAKQPLSFDIETAGGRITCIGFAPSPTHAIVVPFTYGYWKNDDETKAWNWVRDLLEDKQIVKVAQNQSYDVSWLKYKQNIEVKGVVHDTMHAQHALQPEMEKGLGFLGSIYTNEGAWKTLAKFSESTKADE